MDSAKPERLGELLVRIGLLTNEQLMAVLKLQSTGGGKLGSLMVEQGLLTEVQIAEALAEQRDLEFVDLQEYPIDRLVVNAIPDRVARMQSIIPLGLRDGRLLLAMSDPLDIEAIDDAQMRTGYRITPVVSTHSMIRYAIERYISSADAFSEIAVDLPEETPDLRDLEPDAPVVRLVNQIIHEAVVDRASDIHLEPRAVGMRVRYRVDGVMQEVMEVPQKAKAGVLSRVKVMAELDLAERRRPQDGRIAVSFDGRPVDLRVATLPTSHGESIVIRILNQGLTFYDLEDLGMNAAHLETMEWFLSRPYGAVLSAGPTGSGKSTTLYAALKRINLPTRKIITVEDPVEYQMAGVTQLAVNVGIGLTFARGLRTILRSDPDVVMVGEIRDPETAEIAVRAALTGHLVLSSIHTNDAPSALTRLIDMEVPPYITSSALLGVVAQRLTRRLCDHCKKRVKVDADVLVQAGFSAKEATKVKPYGPVGCERCFKTGYSGRVGLFEIMRMDDELTKLFLREAPADQLRTLAIEHGMITLRRDALDKVAAGLTSLEEVARVVI